jgi:hypothetical protein
VPDADFTSRFFGTTAVFHVPNQLADPSSDWWGNHMSTEIYDKQQYFVGVVNAQRMDKGIEPLLDPNMVQVFANMERQGPGGWEYTIEFYDMRPSEVETLIGLLGGPAKVLPGATKVSYEPVKMRSLWASSENGQPLVMWIGATRLEFAPSVTLAEVKQAVSGAVRANMGEDVPVEVYLTQSSRYDGSELTELSVTIDPNGMSYYEGYEGEYEGEGGY